MRRALIAEMRKMRGSLALLLLLVVPGLLGMLTLLAMATSGRPTAWQSMIGGFVLPLWALFLLPMAVTSFTTLVAQIEYKGRAWDHVLALPVARWRIFAAKACLVLLGVAAMTALAVLFSILGAALGGVLAGRPPSGHLDPGSISRSAAAVVIAAVPLAAIQLWVALRFSSFVVPLAFGIAGTLVGLAVAMTRTDQADWFPWVLPARVLSLPEPTSYMTFGGLAGLLLLTVAVLDLQRLSLR